MVEVWRPGAFVGAATEGPVAVRAVGRAALANFAPQIRPFTLRESRFVPPRAQDCLCGTTVCLLCMCKL